MVSKLTTGLVRTLTIGILLALMGLGHTAAARTLEEVKDSGVVRIGCAMDPLKMQGALDNKSIAYSIGFDLQLALYLEHRFMLDHGVETQFVPIMAKHRVERIKEGDVDLVVSTFSVTEERRQEVAFSMAYHTNPGLAVLVPVDSPIRANDDIRTDTRIVVIDASTSHKLLKGWRKERSWHNSEIVTAERLEEAIQLLRGGEDADAFLSDFSQLLYYDQVDADFRITDVTLPSPSGASDDYAIGLHKDAPALRKYVNEVLDSPRLLVLQNKWYKTTMNDFFQKIRKLLPQGPQETAPEEASGWTIWPFALGGLLLILVIAFVVSRQFGKLSSQVSGIRGAVEARTLQPYELKAKGIEYLKSERATITYFGAEGYVTKSDGSDWRRALSDRIHTKKSQFHRIVDLRTVSEMKTLKPEKLLDYVVWLVRQYQDLEGSLKLYHSPSAPVWGSGFIMILRGKEELLIFTAGSHVNKKGVTVVGESTVQGFAEKLDEMKKAQNEVTQTTLRTRYLELDAELGSSAIDDALRNPDSDSGASLDRTRRLCQKYLEERNLN